MPDCADGLDPERREAIMESDFTYSGLASKTGGRVMRHLAGPILGVSLHEGARCDMHLGKDAISSIDPLMECQDWNG